MKNRKLLKIYIFYKRKLQSFQSFFRKIFFIIKKTHDSRTIIATNSFFRHTFSWLFLYMMPAIATGMIFAAALGRYTTETQFTQSAFQNYLRPYQVQYRECVVTMETLQARWSSLDAMLKFSATNTDATASAPVLMETSDGFVGTEDNDTTDKYLSRIFVSSRKTGNCIEESIRQGEELAFLLGLADWFKYEKSKRNIRMLDYKQHIEDNWSLINNLPKWDLITQAIVAVNDGKRPNNKTRSQLLKLQQSTEKFRTYTQEIHYRHKIWFENINSTFQNELYTRTKRSIGYYFKNILIDLGLIEPRDFIQITNTLIPSDTWDAPVNPTPPSPECSCNIYSDSNNFQTLGDPP